jgi:hypothetical protein
MAVLLLSVVVSVFVFMGMIMIVAALMEDHMNQRSTDERLIDLSAAAVHPSQNLGADSVSGQSC